MKWFDIHRVGRTHAAVRKANNGLTQTHIKEFTGRIVTCLFIPINFATELVPYINPAFSVAQAAVHCVPAAHGPNANTHPPRRQISMLCSVGLGPRSWFCEEIWDRHFGEVFAQNSPTVTNGKRTLFVTFFFGGVPWVPSNVKYLTWL